MSTGHSRRMQIGLVLIGLFVGVSQLQALRTALATYRSLEAPDEVSRYEARFQPLKQALPGHGVVGYVSDDPVHLTDLSSSAARRSFKRYLLTQYALVPIVLSRSLDGEFVVGDFSGSAPDGVVTPPGFIVVKDFSQGVVLFRRLPR